MGCLRLLGVLAIAGGVFGATSPVRAQSLEDLRRRIEDQQRVIDELTSVIEQLQQDHEESEVVLRKLTSDIQNSGGGPAVVSQNLGRAIDERVQSYGLFNSSKVLVSGYGALGYTEPQDADSTFSALFAPIVHYKLSDELHFVGEVVFDAVGTETEVELEIAEIDYFLNDYVTVTGGRFLTPFNSFSERIHPPWINKLPSTPPIYGHGHGMGGGALTPVLSDVGMQLRGGAEVFRGSKVNYAAYLVNGPRLEEDHDEEAGHEEGEEEEAEVVLHEPGVMDLEFGENFTDNNNNKTYGGRIGILPVWNVELGGSVMRGAFDERGDLRFALVGADAELHQGPFEIRSEYLRLVRDLEGGGDDAHWGYYVQGAWRLGSYGFLGDAPLASALPRIELVARWGQVHDDSYRQTQAALGLNYWVKNSFPIKFAYEINRESRGFSLDNDRFLLQLGYGF